MKETVEIVKADADGVLNYQKAGLAILDLLELHWGHFNENNFEHFVNSGLLFLRYLSYHLNEENRKIILEQAIGLFKESSNAFQNHHPEKTEED